MKTMICLIFAALMFSGCAAGVALELTALEAAEISVIESASLARAGIAMEAGAARGAATLVVADEVAFNNVLARTRLAAGNMVEIQVPKRGWQNLGRVVRGNRIQILDLQGKEILLEGELMEVERCNLLNLRTGPGKDFPSITTVHRNQLVINLGRSENGWVKVRYADNQTGWMRDTYLLPVVGDDDER
jgi:uncharacterized protein YgiM (DUF1202 family)